ncbi:MAG: molybdopterin-dependent oxidoreductase [Candidatus Hydrothermae bacterium]|nr:molybdopterin-dependent oxidoreductase [Candidatus Hydrothermae bacterium]
MKKSVCMRDCFDTCFFKTDYNGSQLLLRPDCKNPITACFLCYKGRHMGEWALSSDRLRTPLFNVKKGSEELQPISWDSAFLIFRDALRGVQRDFGTDKVLVFEFAGTRGIINRFFPYRFFNKVNASFVKHNLCDAGGDEALKDVYGTSVGLSPEDVEGSNLVVYWGMNPVKTNLHGYSFFKRRGFEIGVVDVRKSETARNANYFLKISPSSDLHLALLLSKILVEKGLYAEDFVLKNSIGFDAFRDYLKGLSFSTLTDRCGVTYEEAENFARVFFERKGIIHIGYGFQRSQDGPMAVAMISYLPFLVGHLPGFIYNMDVGLDKEYVKGSHLRSCENNFIYQSDLAEAIENGDVKFLFIYNANPLVTNPNVNRLKRAILNNNVFVVTHDLFLTDTALYSDIVFPAKSFFEYFDIVDSYYHQYVGINEKVFEGWGMSNYELVRKLANYFGYSDPELQEDERNIAKEVLKSVDINIDQLNKKGYLKVERKFQIGTPSGKVEFVSRRRKKRNIPDFPDISLERIELKQERFPLRLLSLTCDKTITSQYSNTLGEVDARVFINPKDAETRGLVEGERVNVFNDKGSIFTTVHIDDSLPQGSVVMFKAFWPSITGFTVNELTDDHTVKEFGSQAAYHDTYVEVMKVP